MDEKNILRKSPELTVVVIAYNNELYIEEALESLHEQTFQDMEVVVVNDHSTDRTGELIDQFVKNKPKFKAIHLPENSGGCSVPRNTGIANSSGKYIMFLDGDDWYTKDACEQMVAAIKRTDSDFVAGQVIRTNNYEIWYHRQIYSRERTNINIREFTELFFDSLSVNKIYKRTFLDKHKLRFPEGIHYEDILFTGKAYFLADSVSIIPKPIYYWRVVENAKVKSITNQRSEINNLIHRLTSHRLLDKFLIETGNYIYLEQKNNKFLRHDLRLYVNDYDQFDDEYKEQFHKHVNEYLHEHINKYEFLKLAEDIRIMYYLIYINDVEAFQDYLAYTKGLPTKQNRILYNGEHYYFKSEKSKKEDQKFLKIANPKISYSINDIKLEGNKLSFSSSVSMDSVPVDEFTYYWCLKNIHLKTVVYPQTNNKNESVFLINDIPPGNYYLSVVVNHLGETHERRIERIDLEFFPNLRNIYENFSIATFINTKNRVGIKIEPIKQWHRFKWGIKRRRIKNKNKERPNIFNEKWTVFLKNKIKKLSVRPNWVIFESHMGKQYSDSPKYIYEELMKQNKKMKYIWSFENPDNVSLPGPAIKVKRNSIKHYYYLNRSKYWVDNQGMAHLAKKKKEQIYLQTWHGTPLKKMGYDQNNLKNVDSLRRLRKQVYAWDYFVSPNAYSTEIFKRAFLIEGEVIETGYPRNDILVQQPVEVIKKVKEQIGIPDGKKVVLYAPTFRDWDQNSHHNVLRDIQTLSREIDKDTIILLRLHYLLATKVTELGLPEQIINVSTYSDIQELYLISDMLITDYSSVMFDFAVLKRPIILYCYDLEDYLYYRGTYFDIAQNAPGPICNNIEEVISFISSPESLKQYDEKLLSFNRKFASLEDGHASERVIEKVFK